MKKYIVALFSVLTTASATTITVNPGDNVQAKCDLALAGDTVQFNDGNYSIGSLKIKSSATYTSVNPRKAILSGAIIFPGSASNVTIKNLSIKGATTLLQLGSGSNNTKIIGNDLSSFGANGQGWGFQGVSTTNLLVDHNYIHDALGSQRDFDLSGDTTNFTFSYNRRHMLSYGGHIDWGNMNNVKLVSNYTTAMYQMGWEIQDEGYNAAKGESGLLVQYNVFTDWYHPFSWSFGMSIPPQRMKNANISFNYISVFAPGKTSPTWGWGKPWSNGKVHASYGIEYGVCGEPWGDTASCMAEGNILVGPWTGGIICAEKDSPFKNNKFYGQVADTNGWQPGSPWWCEGGLHGNGNFKDLGGNVYDQNLSNAPPPSAFPWAVDTMANAGPDGGSTPPPPPPSMTVAVSNLSSDATKKVATGHFVISGKTGATYKLCFISTGASDDLGCVSSSSAAMDVVMPSYGWDLSATPSVDSAAGSALKFSAPKINNTSAPWPIPSSGAYSVYLVSTLLPPQAPSALTGKVATTTSIVMMWKDNSDNETSFEVERRQKSTDAFVKIASLPSNSIGYTDNDPALDIRKPYDYRVRAANATGASGYSNIFNVVLTFCSP